MSGNLGGNLPLSGIAVLDLTHVWSGPMATRVLAALGAQVLKVEGPDRQDFLRGGGALDVHRRYPDQHPGDRPENRNAWFNTQNSDKSSVVLDLKSDRGREVLLELVADSDVVASNFRPGVLDRMGLGYGVLAAARKDVILVEMPGYPADGPMGALAGYGAQFEARSGSSVLMGSADVPVLTGYALADPTAGLSAAGAVVTALARRRRTGQGARIEVVQSEVMLPLIGEYLLAASVGHSGATSCNGDERVWLQTIVGLPDGSWLAVRIQDDAQASTVRTLLGLCSDAGPAEVERALALVPDATATALWLQQHHVSAGRVATLSEVFNDSHLRAAGFYRALDHPDAGRHDHPGFPGRIAGQRPAPRRGAPCFGADTRATLRDRLGLPPADVDQLVRDGIAAESTMPVAG